MKRGMGRNAPIASRGPLGEPVPAIVFHGDGDTTVDPCNGADVITQCTGTEPPDSNSDRDALAATVERGSVPGGRDYTRTVFTDTAGVVVAEHWLVHGAGHAWFGGDATGSYTDPSGPDASEHMLRFFSARSRAAIN
jgi:poly(3-hydroxybutyrate) depolymerase